MTKRGASSIVEVANIQRRRCVMKHHYSTINGIVTTFSDIHQSAQKGESISVYMERAAENGFDTAEILLPSISFVSYTHKRPLRGHCAPPLQKPSQSVCAFGLTSWGFMVKKWSYPKATRITPEALKILSWSERRDLNPRPLPPQGSALPS